MFVYLRNNFDPEQFADVEFYRGSRVKQLTGKRKESLNTFLLILANNKKRDMKQIIYLLIFFYYQHVQPTKTKRIK